MKKLLLFVFLGFLDVAFAGVYACCRDREMRLEIQIRDVTTPGHPDRVRSLGPFLCNCGMKTFPMQGITDADSKIRKRAGILDAGLFGAVFKIPDGVRLVAFCKSVCIKQGGRVGFPED